MPQFRYIKFQQTFALCRETLNFSIMHLSHFTKILIPTKTRISIKSKRKTVQGCNLCYDRANDSIIYKGLLTPRCVPTEWSRRCNIYGICLGSQAKIRKIVQLHLNLFYVCRCQGVLTATEAFLWSYRGVKLGFPRVLLVDWLRSCRVSTKSPWRA